jgi:hypothetical protein
MQVPSITYSNFFGNISKVRWYSVTDYFNGYDVDLYIYTSRGNASQVSIENRNNLTGSEWAENIPTNVTQNVIIKQVNILHVPVIKAQEYVVINRAN